MTFLIRTKTLSLIIASLIVLGGCSSKGPVIRNSEGKRPRSIPRNIFSGVRKKIAILNFFNESPFGGRDLAIQAGEELKRELSRTGEFMIDPIGHKVFGTSKQIYSSGGTKLIQLSRKAKMNGLNFILYGRIIKARVREKTDEIGLVKEVRSYTESKVEVRLFDVTSGKEIYRKVVRGFADDSDYRFFMSDEESRLEKRRNLLRYGVKVAVRRAIPSLIKTSTKLDWVGRVAKISGKRIYINAGRESGLRISDILRVITEGPEIFDPETGALIGKSKGELKGTVEIIDYFGRDGSIGILHSGGSVQEGDFVRLY